MHGWAKVCETCASVGDGGLEGWEASRPVKKFFYRRGPQAAAGEASGRPLRRRRRPRVLTREADRAARAGDYRKALVGELFAARLTTPESPASALTDGYAALAELYEPLVAWSGCSEEDYRSYLRALGRS